MSTSPRTKADLWLLPVTGARQPGARQPRSTSCKDRSHRMDAGLHLHVGRIGQLAGVRAVVSSTAASARCWSADGIRAEHSDQEGFLLRRRRPLDRRHIDRSRSRFRSRPGPSAVSCANSGVNVYRTDYAVSGDGQRFLIDAVDGSDKGDAIAISVDWLAAMNAHRGHYGRWAARWSLLQPVRHRATVGPCRATLAVQDPRRQSLHHGPSARACSSRSSFAPFASRNSTIGTEPRCAHVRRGHPFVVEGVDVSAQIHQRAASRESFSVPRLEMSCQLRPAAIMNAVVQSSVVMLGSAPAASGVFVNAMCRRRRPS